MRPLPEGTKLGLLDVSRETLSDLWVFSQDLLVWSSSINLVAPASAGDFWSRHIEDCAQLVSSAPTPIQSWCDLGSGGGLPGIVVAIILRELMPATRVTMIESDARKAAFLKLSAKKFDLNAHIIRARIEAAAPNGACVVSARALASLPTLLGLVKRHISDDGVALLPKGRNFEAEVDQARASWHFDLDVIASLGDPEARVLRISQIRARNKAR